MTITTDARHCAKVVQIDYRSLSLHFALPSLSFAANSSLCFAMAALTHFC